MIMNKDDFVHFLTNTLIPDLRESGQNNVASDFQAAVLFINGADEVDINEESATEV